VLQPELQAALASSGGSHVREQFMLNAESASDYLFSAFIHQVVVAPDFVIDNCRDIASWKQ
jgi:hypothetical protein